MTGMLSYQRSGVLHLGQCDGGVISDSPRGNRQTTTFKKLPMHAPRAKKKRMKGMWTMRKGRRQRGRRQNERGG
jgi:hypothetical protein